MPLERADRTLREGDGWTAYIEPTRLVILVEDDDEDALERAVNDLRTWGDPADWVLDSSGWTDQGVTYFSYSWEPAYPQLPVVA